MRKHVIWIAALLLLTVSGFAVYAAVQPSSLGASGSVTDEDGYAWPDAQPVTDATEHGLDIGELNENKTIVGSSKVTISGLPESRYAVAYDEVTVFRLGYDGQAKETIVGQALAFADENKSADNGWVMVDTTEAAKWVEVFNGNPAYVLGGNVIYSHIITASDGKSYRAYNLADIAVASGGRGVDFGFKKVNGKWQNYTTYEATPRPKGWITPLDNKTYKIGDTVPITGAGQDFSIYDRGIDAIILSVINKDTGRGYKSEKGVTSMPYQPQEVGLHEATFIMRDRHNRTPLGSSSMSESIPFTTTFRVEENGNGGPGPNGENLAVVSIKSVPEQPKYFNEITEIVATYSNLGASTWSPDLETNVYATEGGSSLAKLTPLQTEISAGKIKQGSPRWYLPDLKAKEQRTIRYKVEWTAEGKNLPGYSSSNPGGYTIYFDTIINPDFYYQNRAGRKALRSTSAIQSLSRSDQAKKPNEAKVEFINTVNTLHGIENFHIDTSATSEEDLAKAGKVYVSDLNVIEVKWDGKKVSSGYNFGLKLKADAIFEEKKGADGYTAGYDVIYKVTNIDSKTLHTGVLVKLSEQNMMFYPLLNFKPNQSREVRVPIVFQ